MPRYTGQQDFEHPDAADGDGSPFFVFTQHGQGVLTDRKIKQVIKAGEGKMLEDGAGLFLRVFAGNSRAPAWELRYASNDGRKIVRLGVYGKLSIKVARMKAKQYRNAWDAGVDPQGGNTFGEWAAMAQPEYQRNKKWTDKYAKEFLEKLKRHCPPIWGKPIVNVTERDVIDILTPLYRSKPPTARIMEQHIRKVLAFAHLKNAVTHNVAGGLQWEAVSSAMRVTHIPKGHRRMPADLVPEFIQWMRHRSPATPQTKLACEFLILTCARAGEIRGATWDEIDLNKRLWRLSPDRMKMRRGHVVPLSDQAMDVLERAAAQDKRGLVFPSPVKSGAKIDDNTIRGMLYSAPDHLSCYDVHGWRKSFSTWAGDRREDRVVKEECLAHHVSGIEAVYDESELIDLRRDLLQRWADHCMLEHQAA